MPLTRRHDPGDLSVLVFAISDYLRGLRTAASLDPLDKNWRAVATAIFGGSSRTEANVLDLAPVAYWRLGEGAAYASVVAGTAPVSHWRLGEATGTVAADAMGANAGTYAGLPTLGVAGALAGDANTAVRFDGVNDGMSSDVALPALPAARTMAAWVNFDDTTSDAIFLSSGSNDGYLRRLSNQLYMRYVGTDGVARAVISTALVGLGMHFLVGTHDGVTARVYIDGVEVGSTTAGGSRIQPAGTVWYVGSLSGVSFWTKGVIDEPAIWHRALTAAEVANIYAAGTRTMAVDISGNARHGTYVGSPTLGVAGALAGDANTAVTFDVVSVSHISFAAAPVGAWTEFTVAAWFKTTANGYMMGQHDGTAAAQRWAFDVDGGKLRYFHGGFILNSPAGVVDGTWHFGVATLDLTDVARLYLDGQEVAINTHGNGFDPALPFAIARLGNISTNTFTGTLDEPAIWNRALTAAEVAALYAAGI